MGTIRKKTSPMMNGMVQITPATLSLHSHSRRLPFLLSDADEFIENLQSNALNGFTVPSKPVQA